MADEVTADADKPVEHLNNLTPRQFHELVSACEHTLTMLAGKNPEVYCTILAELIARMVMDRDEPNQADGYAFLANFHKHLDKVVEVWRASIAARKEADKAKLN